MLLLESTHRSRGRFGNFHFAPALFDEVDESLEIAQDVGQKRFVPLFAFPSELSRGLSIGSWLSLAFAFPTSFTTEVCAESSQLVQKQA